MHGEVQHLQVMTLGGALDGREYSAAVWVSYITGETVLSPAPYASGYIRREAGICRLASEATGIEWKRVISSMETWTSTGSAFTCTLARYSRKCTAVVYLSPRHTANVTPKDPKAVARGKLGGSIGGKVQSKAKVAAYKRNFSKRWK